jgi:type I restriction enzyme, S subunit
VEQQRRIAEILSALDETIERTEALIAKYQQIKTGFMHDLFSRGVTPDGKLRPTRTEAPQLYKESPLGWIPREWECLTIEQLLAKTFSPMRSGPFGSSLLKDELVEDGVPYLGIDNVFTERFVPLFRRFVSRQKFTELIRYAVFPRDVIITIMGTVERSCVVPASVTEAMSSKHLWTMTFDMSRVLPELVCWQLNYAKWVRDWFARHSQGAVMEAIQSSTLRSLRLPVPPMEEQHNLLQRYIGCTTRIDQEQIWVAKLRQQKQGLMHDLLTGRVRVKPGESAAA